MNNCIVALSILNKTDCREAEVFDVECLVYGEDGLSTKAVLKVYEPYVAKDTAESFMNASVDSCGRLVDYKVSRNGVWMIKYKG
jgi:hypothetical protein